MKKIINNRKYDTDTATLVGEWSSDYPINDFHYEEESLYVKRNGEYFLHGSGNAMSKYAKSMGNNSWGGGSEIIPLSYESAREWAEAHLDADDYETAFGEVSEDGDDTMLSVRVSANAKAMLDRLSARLGKSKGEVVSKAIVHLYASVETDEIERLVASM